MALISGDLSGKDPPLVRVHLQDTLGDVVSIQSKRLGWPLRSAMKQVAASGNGVVVILRYGESPRQFISAVSSLDRPLDEVSGRRDGATTVLRTYGTGAQILRDLGVTRMRVLSAPKQMHGISGFGLEIVDYVDHSE